MDKIWDRNPSKSEVISRCGVDEKNERPRRIDNSRTLPPPTLPQKTLWNSSASDIHVYNSDSILSTW